MSVILHLYAGSTISYSHEPSSFLCKASFVCPCNDNSWNFLYNSSLSIPSCFFQVTAPPSAVVKFFTAWKEKHVKSAYSPDFLLFLVAPKPCAESATIATLPIAFCILLLGLNSCFLFSTTSCILSIFLQHQLE